MPIRIRKPFLVVQTALWCAAVLLITGCKHRFVSRIDTEQQVLSVLGLKGNSARIVNRELIPPEQLIPQIRPAGSVWKLSIENAQLLIPCAGVYLTNPFVRSLNVFFSPTLHQILKVESVSVENSSAVPFPSVEIYERQLKQISQNYLRVPEHSPSLTFSAAVARACGSYFARAITAYYVVEQFTNPPMPARAVWIVHALDISPISELAEHAPISARQMRSSLDAETGEWYYTDTLPQMDEFLSLKTPGTVSAQR